jgi:hypothetical protein
MTHKYQIHEKDYLDFQLYTASKGARFYKKMRNGRFFLTLTSLITASYFLYIKDWGMLTYFGLTTLVFFFLYPRYFKCRQKVHYTKFIRRHYRSIFGQNEALEVKGKTVNLINETGEGQLKASEFTTITETKNHFFAGLESGSSLIIPKGQLSDPALLLRELKGLKVKVISDLEWTW